MIDDQRPDFRDILMDSGIVSHVDKVDGGLAFEIESESGNLQAHAVSVLDSVVLIFDLGITVSDDGSVTAISAFMNECSSHLPFGEFYLAFGSDVSFKIYLFGASASSEEDVKFAILWAQDILNSYKNGFHAVLGGFAEPKEVANKIRDALMKRDRRLREE